jgi:hypothetical protein
MQKKGDKRAQTSQMFVYIFSLLVMSAVLIFGFRAIVNIRERGEDMDRIRFESDLVSDIAGISKDYDSVRIDEYTLPKGYFRVCFVDPSAAPVLLETPYGLVNESIKSGIDANIFLMGDGSFDSIFAGKLSIDCDPYYYCFTNEFGYFELVLDGKGNRTELRPVPTYKTCTDARDGVDGIRCDDLDSVYCLKGYRDLCCKRHSICCP